MAPVSKLHRMFLLVLSLLAMTLSFSAFAQRSDGGISGDAKPGDRVLVQNTGTGFKREGVADDAGKYGFRSLPLGTYRVTVTRGESEVVLNALVTIRPGATARAPKVVESGDAAAPQAAAEAAPASN